MRVERIRNPICETKVKCETLGFNDGGCPVRTGEAVYTDFITYST